MKKLLCILLTVLLLTAFACAEEDGQNPVMNLIGLYQDEVSERATMNILCEGREGGSVEISWSSSAFETTVWTFSGIYNTENNTLPYDNCVKTVYTYDEDGNETAEIVYENGTGMLTVDEFWCILWQDDMEDAGADCVFSYMYAPLIEEE